MVELQVHINTTFLGNSEKSYATTSHLCNLLEVTMIMCRHLIVNTNTLEYYTNLVEHVNVV